MPLYRRGTFDSAIWSRVQNDYPAIPPAFEPGEVFIDVGCHTGAVCELAVTRGATVVGYEANLENYWLALVNLKCSPSVTLQQAAVWRSDIGLGGTLLFTPSADSQNTGGGSVMFSSRQDHWSARPHEESTSPPESVSLSSHAVDPVALDDVLISHGPARVLKLDVEGAEFPILLTSRRLDLVDVVVGEYHEFSSSAMNALAVDSVVGTERYTVDLLRRCLASSGFEVRTTPDRHGRGFFTAKRH